MSTISVSERIEEASTHIMSPRTKARMAGGFYLATILTESSLNYSSPILSSPATPRPRRPTSCRTNRSFDLGSPSTWSNWRARSR